METGNPSPMEQGEESPGAQISEAQTENNGPAMEQGAQPGSMAQPLMINNGILGNNGPFMEQGDESDGVPIAQPLQPIGGELENAGPPMEQGQEAHVPGAQQPPITGVQENSGPLMEQGELHSDVASLQSIIEAGSSGPQMELDDELLDEMAPHPAISEASAASRPSVASNEAGLAEGTESNVDALHRILTRDIGSRPGGTGVLFIVRRNGVNGPNSRSIALSSGIPTYGREVQVVPTTDAAGPNTTDHGPAEPGRRQPTGRRSCPRSFSIFY